MPLRRKHPSRNIHTLDARMLARAPDTHLRARGQQIGGGWRGRVDDVVEVHLVQEDVGGRGGQVEQRAPDVRELDGRVREFPLPVGFGGDGRAERAA